jgi:hypothetical protein
MITRIFQRSSETQPGAEDCKEKNAVFDFVYRVRAILWLVTHNRENFHAGSRCGQTLKKKESHVVDGNALDEQRTDDTKKRTERGKRANSYTGARPIIRSY